MRRWYPTGSRRIPTSPYNDRSLPSEHAPRPLFGSPGGRVDKNMRLEAGYRLGPYEVDGFLASGGMGDVYRARDTRLQRPVALKVLAPSVTADADRLTRFAQEARTTALVNHPNIVTVYDVGLDLGLSYVVSELLTGDTLRGCLKNGALPVRTAIVYALEIARGLIAAHHLDVVHRDLKPENIFVTED